MLTSIPAAAAFLDSIEPGWHNNVDLSTLELDKPDLCVLGQLYEHKATDNQNGWYWAMYVGPNRERFVKFETEFATGDDDWEQEVRDRRSRDETLAVSDPVQQAVDLLREKGYEVEGPKHRWYLDGNYIRRRNGFGWAMDFGSSHITDETRQAIVDLLNERHPHG